MLRYEWLDADEAPWEVIELMLCRDVYHCTPSELMDEPWRKIRRHLIVMSVEAEVNR